MLEDSLQEVVTETRDCPLCRAFMFTCVPVIGDSKLFMRHKEQLLWGEEKGGEEQQRGTPYLPWDLSDYRDEDTTLFRKISHPQSLRGFSFFLEILQTCPSAPSISELNPDT